MGEIIFMTYRAKGASKGDVSPKARVKEEVSRGEWITVPAPALPVVMVARCGMGRPSNPADVLVAFQQ
jgi:hypothetical protein